MEPIVGSGKYTYRVNEEWQRPPAGLEVRACALSVDSQDRVYCFGRNAEHLVVILDRNGNFLSHWGAGLLTFPHAIRIVRENGRDVVWLCDEHYHQFQKFTTDGKLLQAFGEKAGYIECGYTSLAQCALSASGRAAQCIVNPYFASAQVPAGPHFRRHRRFY